ncbi:Hsp70 protein [Amycolatopsis arida]|uniref:Hsp70 protein n=1 Tax=Amycolatopsis arida TaxID=587909 RepID=A0A1I5SFS2_9PSEU|nr:Hsp70 family protein [Amycolatopsis arida]TDX96489.1 Hsp70 protein [Amycolatopsis arida]SFP69559.1 Hsp70 protein [Amycolatopsis arida]
MRYVLGVDVGATRTAAAVSRHAEGSWDEPQPASLDGGRWVESVLHVSPEGVLAGGSARRLGLAEPERVATGFLRRIGDDVPFVLGDARYRAEVLTAALAGWVADRVAEAEDGEAVQVAVTHPPGWGAHRRALLHDALHEAGLPGALLLPSPVAAAQGHEPDVGAAIAVCRLGGEHVEATVLRRTPSGFELVAHTEAAEPAAGAHFDDLLLRHVLGRLDEPAVAEDVAALARLRAECTAAKERLSSVTDVTIPAPFAAAGGVHVSRAEFERLIRPAVAGTVALLRGVADAVPAERLAVAVLAGGSARVPLVTDLVQEALPCRVAVDADPGTALCRGAALAAQPHPVDPPHPPEPRGSSTALVASSPDLPALPDDDLGPPPRRPPVEITPLEPPRTRLGRPRRATTTKDGE